jgi:hypothetical protein
MSLFEYKVFFDELLNDPETLNTSENYQYILEKSCQIGYIEYVEKMLKLSSYLHLDKSLNLACVYGHYLIVELLLNSDMKQNNIPLTHLSLLKAIEISIKNKHSSISKLLENYYFRTYTLKDSYNKSRFKLPHQEKMERLVNKKLLDDTIKALNIDTEISIQRYLHKKK